MKKLLICLIIGLMVILTLRFIGEHSTNILHFGAICYIVGILKTCFLAQFLKVDFTKN